MAGYEGMRWFKCDLQVQTPEDSAHWLDANTKLGEPRRQGKDETRLQDVARKFLERAHDLDLSVIGVTDHNFSGKTDPRDWFLTHLIEQNAAVAKQRGRPLIWIFPGFEIDIGYHVLCLFDPVKKGDDLRAVSELLTSLGLPVAERFKSGKPEPLRHENANVALRTVLQVVQEKYGGMVIAAHAFDKDGICYDAARIQDYQNEKLLCVEVASVPLTGKAKAILEGRDAQWSRPGRQPAHVMSSDAKSLQDVGGAPKANSLGYRYTWIKMSQPSIESLRQAFLDNESRIHLPSVGLESSPSVRQTHPRILSLKVSNLAFLQDQEVVFSPNLNCIIGGRGAGKSTVLECIRFILDRTEDDDLSKEARAKLLRIRKTFTPSTTLTLKWQPVPGAVDEIVLRPQVAQLEDLDEDAWEFVGRALADARAALAQIPIQIFSQGQLSDITSAWGTERNRLRPVVDARCAADLARLKDKADDLKRQLLEWFASQDRVKTAQTELTQAQQQKTELDRQWTARSEVQAEAEAYNAALAARSYLNELETQLDEAVGALRLGLPDSVDLSAPDGSERWPYGQWFAELAAQLSEAQKAVRKDIERAMETFVATTRAALRTSEQRKQVDEAILFAERAFLEACKARGLQPQDVSRLQEIDRQRQILARTIQEKQRLIAGYDGLDQKVTQGLLELAQNWRTQHNARNEVINRINKKIPHLQLTTRFMADKHEFAEQWKKLAPKDGRTRLGRAWDQLGDSVLAGYLASSSQETLWGWFRDWVRGAAVDVLRSFEEHRSDLKSHLTANLSVWRDVRTTSISDLVDLVLYRGENNERVGSVQSGDLSEGQRNTAVLTLLLAEGDGPIVIDQPEDDVDSSFLYEELVPVLRTVKGDRQLIVATHNANIPVNADAELIYALQAKGGRGQLRAEGGLDRRAVVDAVLDIMEGSEDAFRKRSQKYHF